MDTNIYRFLLCVSLIFICNIVNAATIFQEGGGLLTSYDRTANFNTLDASSNIGPSSSGISLLNYTENGLIISVDDKSFYAGSYGSDFDGGGHYYGGGGNNSYVTITTVDDLVIAGLEVAIADGWLNDGPNIYWETWLDGVKTTSGTEDFLTDGVFYTFLDSSGFDELRIAAYFSEGSTSFGGEQAIALDNLSVQFVPVPAAAWLFGSGLLGLIGLAKRKS